MFMKIRAAFARVITAGLFLMNSTMAHAEPPKVEIFSGQQPILIGLNQQKEVTLLGAVYDDPLINGLVNIVPNGPIDIACPIFLSGANSVTYPGNTANLPFRVLVRGPSSDFQVGQTFTCALAYSAARVVINPYTGQPELIPVKTKGNEVRFQYTVKRRLQ